MEKIIDIIESIAHEKSLKKEDVKDRVKTALIKTAKKVFGHKYEYGAEIDEKTKKLNLFQKILVLADNDEKLEFEPERFISLSKAKEMDRDFEIGDELTYPLDITDLGRTAAAILARELDYEIQKLSEQEFFQKFKNKIGKIVSGSVVRVDNDENTYIEIDEIRAILPRKNRIKGEKFKVSNTIRAIVKSVNLDRNNGIMVELSRTAPKFLEELLRLEVPEIKEQSVIIEKSARIPGDKAKVSLYSLSPSIDPVGATVGTKGMRINSVSREIMNENIDCIEYSKTPEIYVARALAPAIVGSVKINGQKAIVTLLPDQKSKAIGKNGINIRLASMLTGYEIELSEKDGVSMGDKSQGENALMALFKD